MAATTAESIAAYVPGFPDREEADITGNVGASSVKSTVFATALTIGEIKDSRLLVPLGVAVNGMYLMNDSIDGGSPQSDVTMEAIGWVMGGRAVPEEASPALKARIQAIGNIEKAIRAFARPEDVPFVRACFYDQVLAHEVAIQALSRGYVAAKDKRAFLAEYGMSMAHDSTESAGFGSVSSGVYGGYRLQDGSLPPLSEVYGSPDVRALLQTYNVFARLLDDLGDWQKDGRGEHGDSPVPNIFVLNPFNQYHPSIIQTFCQLAAIPSEREAVLHDAIANFHTDRSTHSKRVIDTLCAHMRDTVLELPRDVHKEFGTYIDLAKRVGEIALVNQLGDDALRPQT